MYNFSKNEKTVLALAYKHYLETGERSYTLLMKQSKNSDLLNALRSLSENKYIYMVTDNLEFSPYLR